MNLTSNISEDKRRYTKYTRHVNDSHERVDAKSVNKIQEDINKRQLEENKIKDTAFEERVYTIFNNNLFVNAMFIDLFKTGEYINKTESENIDINSEKLCLNILPDKQNGTAKTSVIKSVHGEEVELNDFILVANEDKPLGSSIQYFIETHEKQRWEIPANRIKTPLHLMQNLKYGFRLIVELRANAKGEKPSLTGYAILYFDAQVEANYGMTNPDLMRFP